MEDIARLAGVSESTVSRALAGKSVVSEKTRAHIQKIASDLGYRVNPAARSLRSRRTQVVSVAVPLVHEQDQHLSDPFMMLMLAHLADELTERGYSMLLSRIPTHDEGWIEHLVRPGRADGVVLVGQSLEHESINRAAHAGVPLVVWGAKMANQPYVSVGSDNRLGGLQAGRHLAALGCRRIAFLGDERLPEIGARFEGYREALQEHGLAADPRLHVRTHFIAETAYDAVKAMLAKGAEPDGIFAASDVIAISAVRALAEAGRRVPLDVSVVGYDDIPLARHTHPTLTTVRQDIQLGARLLTEALLGMIEGHPGTSVEFTPELIVRGSA